MTKTIKITPSYKLVYDRFNGVCKFIRLKDNKCSYWSTGHYCQKTIERAKEMNIKELEQLAETFKYY